MDIDVDYDLIISKLLSGEFVRATKYLSPTLIVRATRRRYGGRILKDSSIEIVVKIGKPNYLEREFINQLKKMGEPFPVKKVQLKLYNPPKNKLKKK